MLTAFLLAGLVTAMPPPDMSFLWSGTIVETPTTQATDADTNTPTIPLGIVMLGNNPAKAQHEALDLVS